MILLIDFYNIVHRARFGYDAGQHTISFNFFKGLRPLVAQFKPAKIYVVTEGCPKRNLELLPEYKGDRPATSDNFTQERSLIEGILKACFPITFVRHPDLEADDTIYNVAKLWHKEEEVAVVSSDSDFIQMYAELPQLTLWHPIKKEAVKPPPYDYVTWKSLRGDKTDNVPGIPGIGDKRAQILTETPALLSERLLDPSFREQFERNYGVIKFQTLETTTGLEIHEGFADWRLAKQLFTDLKFNSIVRTGTWEKYVNSFPV